MDFSAFLALIETTSFFELVIFSSVAVITSDFLFLVGIFTFLLVFSWIVEFGAAT